MESQRTRVVAGLVWIMAAGLGGGGCSSRSDAAKHGAASDVSASTQAQEAAKPAAAASTPSSSPAAATVAPLKVTALTVKTASGEVNVSWSLPEGATVARILRRPQAQVEGLDDARATLVYTGASTSLTHPLSELDAQEAKDVDPAALAYHYAAFACRSADDCDRTPVRAVLRPKLMEALRAGGYQLFFRHGTANECQDVEPLGQAHVTKQPGWWKSCDADCATATARQISPSGIAEAKQLGVDLARLAIPVSQVLASEFCRNVSSAKAMALRHRGKLVPIQTRKELTSFVYDEKKRCGDTYKLLGRVPARGTNIVIVGQKGNECPVVGDLDPSEAAIFKPTRDGAAQNVATLKWADWANYR